MKWYIENNYGEPLALSRKPICFQDRVSAERFLISYAAITDTPWEELNAHLEQDFSKENEMDMTGYILHLENGKQKAVKW